MEFLPLSLKSDFFQVLLALISFSFSSSLMPSFPLHSHANSNRGEYSCLAHSYHRRILALRTPLFSYILYSRWCITLTYHILALRTLLFSYWFSYILYSCWYITLTYRIFALRTSAHAILRKHKFARARASAHMCGK